MLIQLQMQAPRLTIDKESTMYANQENVHSSACNLCFVNCGVKVELGKAVTPEVIDEVKPDGPTAVLIALASHAGLLKANFVPEELRQQKDRIKKRTLVNRIAMRSFLTKKIKPCKLFSV